MRPATVHHTVAHNMEISLPSTQHIVYNGEKFSVKYIAKDFGNAFIWGWQYGGNGI